MIDVKSISGEVLVSVPILKDAVSHEELMTSDYIQLHWDSDKGDVLPLGAYIEHNEERYSLLEPYSPSRQNEGVFRYSPQFHSRIIRWQKIIVPVYTYNEDGVTVKSRELDWNFTGTPADAMYMVKQALRNELGEEWNTTLGNDLPETITIAAQSSSVWSILSEIAEQCETEWWAEKKAQWLHLSKCNHGVSVDLEVGKNVKVPSTVQSGQGYFTRFYAFGSSRNVTQMESAVQGSIVNKRLTLDPAKYPGGYKDIRGHFSGGVYVSDLHPEEVMVKSLYFDEVYPSSKLTIAEVRKRMRYHTDDDGNYIRIGGTDEEPIYDQYAIWYFKIPGFDFKEEMIIENLELSVAFKSGELRGREFALTYHPKDKKVADKADVDKEFSVKAGEYEITFDESDYLIVPGVSYIIPHDGDEITVFNIEMPQEYKESAYLELERELDKEIDRLTKDNKSYEVDSNPVAFYEGGIDIHLGQSVNFTNNDEPLATRVMMVEKHIDYPFEQRIRIGNEIVKGSRQQLKDEVRNVGEEVRRMNKYESSSSVIQKDHSRELMLTMGRYLAMKDTLNMLQGAIEGYTGGINPVTIETMAMLVGNEALQFKFVKSRTDFTLIDCPLVYNEEAKQLNAAPCALVHLTLDIDSITAPNVRKNTDYRAWDMEEWHSEIFTDATKKYYVYAVVEANGTAGTYELVPDNAEPIGMRDKLDSLGVYYLLVGILNAEYAETRELLPLYGFTQILPGQITTDVIRSADGSCYFDLARNEIGGIINFAAGSKGSLNIGNQNMLRNSGFTGDYLSEPLADETVMDAAKVLYSDPLDHWHTNGTATVIDLDRATSGKGVSLVPTEELQGHLSQNLYNKTIVGESYVISFYAKTLADSTANVSVNCGGVQSKQEVTGEWKKYTLLFEATATRNEFSIYTDGEVTICDLQLERGTIATSWGMSPLDNSSDRTYYQALKYLSQALAGSTTMAGGLVLTNTILLGNESNNSEFVERAGANGLYFNDDDTPAFWAGGTMQQAIYTIAKYKDNPSYEPTEEELKSMALFVVTHGGRAILNDAIYRGTVYSKGGFFGGRLQMPFEDVTEVCQDSGNGVYRLTTASSSHIYLSRPKTTTDESRTLYLPNDAAFDGWILDVYCLPMISKMDGVIYVGGDGIESPIRVASGGFQTLTNILAEGGYMRFVNKDGKWLWLNERDMYVEQSSTVDLDSFSGTYALDSVKKLIISQNSSQNSLTCTLPSSPYDGQEITIVVPVRSGLIIRGNGTKIVDVYENNMDADNVSTVGSQFLGEFKFTYSKAMGKWICVTIVY